MNRLQTEKISYFALTPGGSLLALRLRERFGGTAHLPRCQSLGCGHCSPFDSLADTLPERFNAGDTVVCVTAAGIVFRLLAPHLGSKHLDPAVIVLDEEGRNVIPLLGGHAAGANDLAREIADFLGAQAAITTASDVQGIKAPDEVARLIGCVVKDAVPLRRITSLLLAGERICIEADADPEIAGYEWVPSGGSLEGFAGRLLISYSNNGDQSGGIPTARLIPRCITAGIGCKRGVRSEEIIDAIRQACADAGIDVPAVAALASIDLKSDEAGLIDAAAHLGAKLVFYSPEELAATGCSGGSFVKEKTGTPAVAAPAAILAAGTGEATIEKLIEEQNARTGYCEEPRLLMEKRIFGRVTVALASPDDEHRRSGQVFIVGTGTGTEDLLTGEAAQALRAADVIVGYRTYVEQLRRIYPHKEYRSGSMGKEVERCQEALNLAKAGKNVAMVSSGDPGVYGMAGPLLEMSGGIPVKIVPGVTSAQAAAALLGAPLMNDYITISLSDLLTPRDEVLRRARVAASSDLVVCVYNPSSKKRRGLFEEACSIFLEYRPQQTPAGWVRDAGGPEEEFMTVELGKLVQQETDMRTIIIIGNSKTALINGKMVTVRGYRTDG